MSIARSILLVVLGICVNWGSAAYAVDEKREKEVTEAIQQFKAADAGLDKFFKESAGFVVFPTVGKGGIGLGGAYGTGWVYEKGKWIGEASLTQVTLGFQLGGQTYSELIFFESQSALDDFKKGKYTLSAQVSAVAAASGASANAKYQLGVAVFTLAKNGLMYEASVGGQKFKFKPTP